MGGSDLYFQKIADCCVDSDGRGRSVGEKVNAVIRQETTVAWSGATTVYMWTRQGTQGTSRRKKQHSLLNSM